MKTPAEYVEAALAASPIRIGPRISTVDAQLAVAAALADAERYRQHLVGAVLRSRPNPDTHCLSCGEPLSEFHHCAICPRPTTTK